MINHYELAKKKVLVTGASGFIGYHLCRKLEGLGCKIHGISRVKRLNQMDVIQWWQSDLSEPTEVLEIIKSIKPDIVYHLSSYVTGSRDSKAVLPAFNSNLVSSVNLLSALEKVGCDRVLLIGSMEEPYLDQVEPSSISPYAVSKWSSSIYGRMFHALYDLPVVILHVFMVYGPGQMDLKKLIPYVTISLLKNEVPKLTSGRRQVDWIYIDDVIEGLICCAHTGKIAGCTVEIGSGTLMMVRGVVEELVSLINPGIEPDFGALEDRHFESGRIADAARTYKLLGWKSKVKIEEGLRQTVYWYRDQLITGGLQ
jgi:nucleoside-diphosphate-sugar epimerase